MIVTTETPSMISPLAIDPRWKQNILRYFIYYEEKHIIYISCVWSYCEVVIPSSWTCRWLNRIISSLAESHFTSIPFLLVLFSFSRLLRSSPLFSSLPSLRFCLDLSPSRPERFSFRTRSTFRAAPSTWFNKSYI